MRHDVRSIENETPGETGSPGVPGAPGAPGPSAARPRRAASRLLAGTRIRKKLIILHTLFSIALGVILLLALRPSIREVVLSAEAQTCRVALDLLEAQPDLVGRTLVDGVTLTIAREADVGLDSETIEALRSGARREHVDDSSIETLRVIRWAPDQEAFLVAGVRSAEARKAVVRLYMLLGAALLSVYALIALALEIFVLPQHVYGPIRRILRADAAVQRGDRRHELIPDEEMPADEMGEIMRSRNESIVNIRRHEADLAEALARLETVANDLKRKNFLIESARRNLADQDRLVSLGMMSAGLAHELNTPLAVLKGSVEKLAEQPDRGVSEDQARLMLRVVHRLERLGESLLDFARVRPPRLDDVDLNVVIDEAWTLVRLDREAQGVTLHLRVPEGTIAKGDADRLTQVFVNILRNAADALEGQGAITLSCERALRDGRDWLSITCADDGPGIDPDVLPILFEPFTSTRLDARGTGLGLAVAEGIVREHGGMILARNAPEGGAIFEVMLPLEPVAIEGVSGDDVSARRLGSEP